MHITFKCFGLEFAAECDYEPYVPAQLYGPPERCYPEEGGYAGITSLTVDGKDAMFMLTGDLADDLNACAFDACEESVQARREDAQEARAQARRQDGRGEGVGREGLSMTDYTVFRIVCGLLLIVGMLMCAGVIK